MSNETKNVCVNTDRICLIRRAETTTLVQITHVTYTLAISHFEGSKFAQKPHRQSATSHLFSNTRQSAHN